MNKHRPYIIFMLLAILVAITGCRKGSTKVDTPATVGVKYVEPVDFDFEKIKARGTMIAVVDNSSTGYFIYRGRTMGYEYDLLDRLAQDLGVDLKVVLTADIEEAFDMLNRGKADIMAYHLTVTKERRQRVLFTDPHTEVRQVLVQRKPDNWRKLKVHELEQALLRNPLELMGKEVHTRKGSAFSQRLSNLSEEIGGDIVIIEEAGQIDTETLIKRVADGEIDYTVADEDVGMINATYHPNVDAQTDISFPQQIAWAVRKNSPVLKDSIDVWLEDIKKTPDFNVIYNRYFRYSKSQNIRAQGIYSSVTGGKISPYDELLKEGAETLGLDWLLLASLVYQESKFDPAAESWAGARGLMQLTDITMEEYGIEDPLDPVENVKGGVAHLKWLDNYWAERVSDPAERFKFILASYNVGQGHIIDAMRLTKKYGKDQEKWEDVSHYLGLKSTAQYYQDPVVDFGYCRCTEPIHYVDIVFKRYDEYKTAFNKPVVQPDSTLVTSTR